MKKTNLRSILRFNCGRNANGSFSWISQCLPDLQQLTPVAKSAYKVDVHKLSLKERDGLGNAPFAFGEVLAVAYEKTIYRYREPDFPEDRPCDSCDSIIDFVEYLHSFKSHMESCGYDDFGEYVLKGALSAHGLMNDAFRNTPKLALLVMAEIEKLTDADLQEMAVKALLEGVSPTIFDPVCSFSYETKMRGGE